MDKTPSLIGGRRAKWIRLRLHINILKLALQLFKNPVKSVRTLEELKTFRRKQQGLERIFKFVKSGQRYFWSSELPGFPSPQLDQVIKGEVARNMPALNLSGSRPGLQTLIWGITNRCPLNCSHCYDWENIDTKDKLSLDKLLEVLKHIEAVGLRHVQFSGGEPLARFNDLIALLQEASKRMDCWLLTSGFGLTAEKAQALKKAGLLGVNISLDHWDEKKHNTFRRNEHSFEWVIKAVKHCREADLMVSLSLCATRDFVNKENLYTYADQAREWGVHFIRILEPRSVGSFSGKDVHLNSDSISIISSFFHQVNSDPHFRDYPIVNFFGYHQREIGCMGAGNRYFYIDANAEVHACPFCRGSKGNVLENSLAESIARLRETGCHFFKDQELQ